MAYSNGDDGKLTSWTNESLVAAATDETDTAPPRRAALDELVRRDAVEASAAARQLLDDTGVSVELRCCAAVALRHRIDDQAEQALVRALDSDAQNVVRSSATSLGRIGGRKALDVLDSTISDDRVTRRSIAFAQSLISYRLGLSGKRLTRPDARDIVKLDRDRAILIKTSEVPQNAFVERKTDLARELPGITLSTEQSSRLECRGEKLWLVHPAEILKNGVQQVTRGSRLSSAILKLSACSERWYVHEYILMHPGDDGMVEVFGVRPSGHIVHFGECRFRGDDGTIMLRAVNRAGLPALELSVDYSGDNGTVTVRDAYTSDAELDNVRGGLTITRE